MHFVAKGLKTKIIYVITCALIHPTIMFTILLIRISTANKLLLMFNRFTKSSFLLARRSLDG